MYTHTCLMSLVVQIRNAEIQNVSRRRTNSICVSRIKQKLSSMEIVMLENNRRNSLSKSHNGNNELLHNYEYVRCSYVF